MITKIKKGYWDCKQCGRVGNDGPTTNCAGCGAPRPKDVKFYLSDNPPIVTDPKEIEAALVGPDWICDHCNGHNKFRDTSCHSCGNPKDDSDIHLKHGR